MALEAGTCLGPYEIIELRGKGGMGEVYRATDRRLGRDVAIKTLPAELTGDSSFVTRFRREAEAISRLQHPNICTLHDIGSDRDVDYLVMEFLNGETLHERLERSELPLEEALRIATEIADALHHAHGQGIVHRDLKPGNVMLTGTGTKLLDFGLAKLMVTPITTTEDAETRTLNAGSPLTEIGTVPGTVPYMSPEQLEGKEAGPRSDLFALGCLLYEMITRERAFKGPSKARLIAAILAEDPPSVREHHPTAPPFLDHILGRCLAKNPDERWSSARDIADELKWLISSDGGANRKEQQPGSPIAPSGAGLDYRIEYFVSHDGASVAAARGGHGPPLFVVPAMFDTIETRWAVYAEAFQDREVILYDRRGTGLSERDSLTPHPEPYVQDAQAVVDGFGLQSFDLLGTLMASVEASCLAAENANRVSKLVLRAPVIGMADWAAIPAVRALMAALDQDWDFFTESFSQLILGWGHPAGRQLAQHFRTITTRDELRAILTAFQNLDLTSYFPRIRASTLVEHHPTYFFPDSYSRRITALIEQCRMAIYSGEQSEFLTDFSISKPFLFGVAS